MNKETLNFSFGKIPIVTNDSKSKKMILYFHGLDGSASFSKPLFKNLEKYKIVAMESRGHANSPLKASRSIKKHIRDYLSVINHYKNMGYKIWILGESMGAGYATEIAYKFENIVEGVFAQSIPNKLTNIMIASKWKQLKIQFMTFLSFFTNINYKYKSTVNYELLSSNKSLHRVARIADKNKVRQVRETLATWAITKRAWRRLKKSSPKNKLYYFQPENDVIVNIEKAKKALGKNRNKLEYITIPNARHILMYEEEFIVVINKIKEVLK